MEMEARSDTTHGSDVDRPGQKAIADHDSIILSIRYGSHSMALEAALSDSVQDVKARLESDLGLDLSSMKLIQKGRVLHSDDAIETLVERAETALTAAERKSVKLTVVGTRKEDILKLQNDVEIVTAPKPRKYAVNITALNAQYGVRGEAQSPYRFGSVETLQGLPDEERARHILESLAHDPAILHVMAKHRWSVGTLCEMYPEGMVGVSEVCLLGLNTNKGQRISLRIRTDDLKGFRKMLSIRKVLYHELAHNEHSDHGDKFYILMRQIEREAETHGGGKGRVLDQSFERYERINTVDDSICHEVTPQRLGGESRELSHDLAPRDLVRLAAAQRFDPSGGSDPRSKEQEHEEDYEMASSETTYAKPESTSSTITEAPNLPSTTSTTDVPDICKGTVSNDLSPVAPDLAEQSIVPESGAKIAQEIAGALMGAIDEAMCRAIDADSPSVVELLQRISEVCMKYSAALAQYVIRERVEPAKVKAQVIETLDFLHTILSNAQKPEQKFKKINTSSAKYKRLIGAFQLEDILRVVGFATAPNDSSATGLSLPPPEAMYLVLQRVDAAVMYVTLDILSQQIQIAQNI